MVRKERPSAAHFLRSKSLLGLMRNLRQASASLVVPGLADWAVSNSDLSWVSPSWLTALSSPGRSRSLKFTSDLYS